MKSNRSSRSSNKSRNNSKKGYLSQTNRLFIVFYGIVISMINKELLRKGSIKLTPDLTVDIVIGIVIGLLADTASVHIINKLYRSRYYKLYDLIIILIVVVQTILAGYLYNNRLLRQKLAWSFQLQKFLLAIDPYKLRQKILS